ncbi:MAG: Cas10/Cmr2 second palm domain-containing protein, partial [Candidatus Entotheonellia bacterium]
MPRVHIELQRVQTWLFSVPRLRAMIGANTLLGEVLRTALPDLAREPGRWCLVPLSGNFPNARPDDPLRDHDDPAHDAQQGILSRDGGHFEAEFSSGAEAFADAAAALLYQRLPGLRFRIRVGDDAREQGFALHSTELPVFAPCQWTGHGLASVTVRQGTERANVSLDVLRRHEAARRAEAGNAADLASLLAVCTKLGTLPRPKTFEELEGDGYLAVVHADGNGVGAAAGATEITRAAFFHRNRVLLRHALQVAIDRALDDTDTVCLLPLMLGGDDLLVISSAVAALPFVVNLCAELERLQPNRGEQFHLTLGIGVVISRPTIPFHRLHEVAENLAASAKRRFRGLSEHERASIVDWAVYTTAWIDDPAAVRRQDWIRGRAGEVRILSRRPMPVLGTGLG